MSTSAAVKKKTVVRKKMASKKKHKKSVGKVAPIPKSQINLQGLKKDSLIVQELMKLLQDILVWDDIDNEWYYYSGDYWKRLSHTKMEQQLTLILDRELPKGYSMALLRSIVKLLQIKLVNTGWSSTREMLPLKNGVLNLTAMKLLKHDAKYKIRWRLPYDYDLKADCPTVKAWLMEATSNDIDAVESIRAALFFSLLYHLGTQKFMEIVGPGGTGKSTLVRLIEAFIGKENHATTDLRNLEGNKFETSVLYGKRVVFINDSSRYGGDVNVLKAATGEDPIRFEKKHVQQGESFLAECFIFIVSNEPIQSTDYTSGLSRRRVPVNFLRQVTDADKLKWKKVGGIEKALQAELPGLLNWVISMGKDAALIALGGINGQMTTTQLGHLIQTNKLAAWVEENCILDANAKIYTGGVPRRSLPREDVEHEEETKLYPNYLRWCIENGITKRLSTQNFGNHLEDLLKLQLKLPVDRLEKDRFGRAFDGITIRNMTHEVTRTPILGAVL